VIIITKETRVEQHQINKNHKCYKLIDEYCYRSKNLYNYANYILRQEFIKNKNYIKYYDMAKTLRTEDVYKQLMSQASQCTLQVLDRNWQSYFVAIKDWKKNPHKYLGMPKLPNYKKKNGRFPWFIKNNTSYIKDGYLYFRMKIFKGYGFKTKVTGRLISVRFIPKGSCYVLEIIYEVETPDTKERSNRAIGLDLGVNNLVTMVNNIGAKPIIINGKIIKSYNQWWNKRRVKKMNDLIKRNDMHWCNKLSIITKKRENKINNHLHHVSRFIVNYCKYNNINTIVIGKNDKWKQKSNMGRRNNQQFIFIPHNRLIEMIQYKAKDIEIEVILTEESYTSGTSFLDNELPTKANYNKSRRIHRGLFKSNTGQIINSDVNGAFQIVRKVFPNVNSDGIEGSLVPVIISLGN
jgi:putative transposase